MAESRLSNTACYRKFTRMSPTQFEALHQRVGPLIYFRDTNFRSAITSGRQGQPFVNCNTCLIHIESFSRRAVGNDTSISS